jgi:hypothetical protein
VSEFVEKYSRLSAWPFPSRYGKYHDAYSIIKEQNVVPRTF